MKTDDEVSKIDKVQVWIVSKNRKEVLLLKTNPSRGGFWQPVTGGVEAEDETFLEAAQRELKEETGFEEDVWDLNYSFEFEAKRHGKQCMATESVFFTLVSNHAAPLLDEKEHADFKWVRIDEALNWIKFDSNKDALLFLTRFFETNVDKN